MKHVSYFLILIFLFACASSSNRAYHESIRSDTLVEYMYEPIVIVEEDIVVEEEEMAETSYSYARESTVADELLVTSSPPISSTTIVLAAPILEETELSMGTLVYNLDSVFYYNEPNRVKVKVSNADLVEVTPDLIEEFSPVASGGLIINTIQTSEVMGMKLDEVYSGTVVIDAKSTADQLVEDGWTTWEWTVTPIKKGDCVLKLTAIVRNTNGIPKDVTVFEKTITVKVKNKVGWFDDQFHNALGKFKDYWFFLTVLLIPAATWIYKKRKKSVNK